MFVTSNRSRIIAGVLLLSCSAVLVIAASAQKLGLFSRSSQTILPRVTNKTSSVRVSDVRQLPNGGVGVTLTNHSTQAIYAYTIVTSQKSVQKGVTTFATDSPVAPGATKSERLAAGNLDSAVDGNAADDEIVLSAVYFEGGTVEGDAHHAERLKETMGGMKEQAKLALQILRDAGASSEQDSARLLDAVESQVASMPMKDESVASSRARDLGKAGVNGRLGGEIRKLRMMKAKSGFDLKARLAELISFYERLSEKL